jgi:hypothetical protein
MKLVGFNFTKIHADKTSQENPKKLNANTNIDISEIKEVKSDMFNSQEVLFGVKFDYKISYEPNFAEILFSGLSLVSVSKEESDEILNFWKKQQIPDKFKVPLFNFILKKSNLRALQLEDELGLPPHVPLPSIKSNTGANTK